MVGCSLSASFCVFFPYSVYSCWCITGHSYSGTTILAYELVLFWVSELCYFKTAPRVATKVPLTWPALIKQIGFAKGKRMLVCPNCCTVYEEKQAFERTWSGVKSKKYQHINHPNHIQACMRKQRDSVLMGSLSTLKGQMLWFKKNFAVQSIYVALGHLKKKVFCG